MPSDAPVAVIHNKKPTRCSSQKRVAALLRRCRPGQSGCKGHKAPRFGVFFLRFLKRRVLGGVEVFFCFSALKIYVFGFCFSKDFFFSDFFFFKGGLIEEVLPRPMVFCFLSSAEASCSESKKFGLLWGPKKPSFFVSGKLTRTQEVKGQESWRRVGKPN